MNSLFVLFYILGFAAVRISAFSTYTKLDVEISGDTLSPHFSQFWRSTGLCPPQPHQEIGKYLLSNDMMQNFLLISSTPHQGIQQIRIHWLLDLIKWDPIQNAYNFEQMDQLVEVFHANNLTLGFEVMGNPSSRFTNFDDLKELGELRKLVQQIASRYIHAYGKDFVQKWNFETWNEPDHKDFDNLNITVDGFLNYFSAVSDALKEINPDLTFGGPGGSCRKPSFSKRCWALLDYCSFHGAQKCGLDYISIHKKGNSDAETILSSEIETIGAIHDKYPNLKTVAIVNDEADPLVGWSRPHLWRADSKYAAIIVKAIAMHQYRFRANKSSQVNYRLLSNDNGFLNFYPNFFTQRTLNARFQINNTVVKYAHLVRKPALTVMGMLSKLGDVQVKMTLSDTHNRTFGGIASIRGGECDGFEVSSIFYYSADSQNVTRKDLVRVRYDIRSILTEQLAGQSCVNEMLIMTCHVDNRLTNPYEEWKRMGSPVFPSGKQFYQMHRSEGPECGKPEKVVLDNDGTFTTSFTMRLPGVALQQICWDTLQGSTAPTSLQVLPVSQTLVLIKWDDSSVLGRCVQTYQVEYAKNSNDFNIINDYRLLFNSFYFFSRSVRGSYRVKMIDFFGRSSSYSSVVEFTR